MNKDNLKQIFDLIRNSSYIKEKKEELIRTLIAMYIDYIMYGELEKAGVNLS